MDINDWRGISTVLSLLAFLSVVFWAYSRKRKSTFDKIANDIFDEEEERMHQKSVAEAKNE